MSFNSNTCVFVQGGIAKFLGDIRQYAKLERWGIWYFDSYYFAPFVIFYKESLTQIYVALTPCMDSFDLFSDDDFLIRQRSDPRNDIDTRLDPTNYLRKEPLFP